MDLTVFFSDPRRRNLAILAGVAILSLALAVFALDRRADMVAPKYPPQEFFPHLAGSVNDVTRIRVQSKSGTFDVSFVPMKGWVLPGRGNYPASIEEVRKTLVGMAAFETIEPKTSRPDWFHYVGLDGPPKDGTRITLSDDKGNTLASMIAGKTEDIGDDSGAVGLFVRKPNETQSWLVKSPFELHTAQSDWLDKKVMDVDRARIQEVDVTPSSGPAYSAARAKPSDTDFTLTVLTKGRELAYPGSPDGVASAITNFTFDDIKPAGSVDFTGASRLVTRTFDGLIVSTDLVKQGNDYWVRVAANSQPGKPDAAKEATAINAHADGWAFKLDPDKGATFATTLESLLKPKDTKAKK